MNTITSAVVEETWEKSNAKGSPRLLLLAIATYTNSDGTGAHPSLATLKHLTRLSHSQVCLVLRQLEAQGHLRIAHGAGPHGGNLYTVLYPWRDVSAEQQRIRRKPHTNYAKTFVKIGRRDGFHCQHCQKTVDLEIDHVIPVIKGGTNDLPNLQLLCQSCNGKKGAL